MITITLDNMHQQNLACKRCELVRKCGKIVTGKGNLSSRLLIVTEPPTSDGELFASRPKIIFNEIINKSGLSKELCYVTPIVKCPSYERLGRYKKPVEHKKHHIEACKWWIWNELKLMQPKIVITMGKLALETLCELDKKLPLKSVVGDQIRVSYIDSIFIPTYSASYLLNLSEWHTTKTIKIFQEAVKLL